MHVEWIVIAGCYSWLQVCVGLNGEQQWLDRGPNERQYLSLALTLQASIFLNSDWIRKGNQGIRPEEPWLSIGMPRAPKNNCYCLCEL